MPNIIDPDDIPLDQWILVTIPLINYVLSPIDKAVKDYECEHIPTAMTSEEITWNNIWRKKILW